VDSELRAASDTSAVSMLSRCNFVSAQTCRPRLSGQSWERARAVHEARRGRREAEAHRLHHVVVDGTDRPYVQLAQLRERAQAAEPVCRHCG
jgi:hypothetical protein